MNTMHAFRSLHELLKDIGACSYVMSPDAMHGTTRHTLSFASGQSYPMPVLTDSADLSMRFSEARVGWHITGSLFGYSPEKSDMDPVVFFATVAVKANARVAAFLGLLHAIRQTLNHGVKPDFIDWLRALAHHSPFPVEMMRNDATNKLVCGVCEIPDVATVYFSSTGLWDHHMGWLEIPESHDWPINEQTLQGLEKRCAEYLEDVQHVVREAVDILREPQTL